MGRAGEALAPFSPAFSGDFFSRFKVLIVIPSHRCFLAFVLFFWPGRALFSLCYAFIIPPAGVEIVCDSRWRRVL